MIVELLLCALCFWIYLSSDTRLPQENKEQHSGKTAHKKRLQPTTIGGNGNPGSNSGFKGYQNSSPGVGNQHTGSDNSQYLQTQRQQFELYQQQQQQQQQLFQLQQQQQQLQNQYYSKFQVPPPPYSPQTLQTHSGQYFQYGSQAHPQQHTPPAQYYENPVTITRSQSKSHYRPVGRRQFETEQAAAALKSRQNKRHSAPPSTTYEPHPAQVNPYTRASVVLPVASPEPARPAPVPASELHFAEMPPKQRKQAKAAAAVATNDHSSEFPQLAAKGLYAFEIKGDGNCMFRALSDQFYGDGGKSHGHVRSTIVDYLEAHPDDFKVFIECEGHETWEDHLRRMRCDGVFGDHAEIVAFARAQNVNIIIYQHATHFLVTPEGELDESDDAEATSRAIRSRPTLHIAYHSWEHYSSIRKVAGPHTGPPGIDFKLRMGGNNSSPDKKNGSDSTKNKKTRQREFESKVQVILQSCPFMVGVNDSTKMAGQVLLDHHGNVDKAIEYIYEHSEEFTEPELEPDQPPKLELESHIPRNPPSVETTTSSFTSTSTASTATAGNVNVIPRKPITRKMTAREKKEKQKREQLERRRQNKLLLSSGASSIDDQSSTMAPSIRAIPI